MVLMAILVPLIVIYLVMKSAMIDISTTFLDDGYDDN